MSLMPPSIVNDLRLREHGYKINPLGMGYLPHPDGRSIIDSGTNPATYASYGQYSKKDGERIGALLRVDRAHRRDHAPDARRDAAPHRLD